MRILVVNDDGIEAEGIHCLAELALQLGEVWVAAPKHQCSAMSHRISVLRPMEVLKVDFPVEGVRAAYSIDGTPADCVKVAVDMILPQKPDLVLSGINRGYNVGLEILYSGTVAAAMEGLVQGIPAIALSTDFESDRSAVRAYFLTAVEEVLKRGAGPGEIWNINFPGCTAEEVQGIRWDTFPAHTGIFRDGYFRSQELENGWIAESSENRNSESAPGSDMEAVFGGFVSAGKLKSMVL